MDVEQDEDMIVYKKKCFRCKHVWTPRIKQPKVCPKCHSPYWDKPRLYRGVRHHEDVPENAPAIMEEPLPRQSMEPVRQPQADRLTLPREIEGME